MDCEFKCPLTVEELNAARDAMTARLSEWVTAKYPKIRLATVERNLPALLKIQEYDNACAVCLSVESCPSKDGNRMNGRLDADGVVSVWMEPCPKGHRAIRGGGFGGDGGTKWRKRDSEN